MAEYEMTHTGAELDEAITKVLDGYQDVSAVTARAGDVVQGKTIVTTEGPVNGTMIRPSGTVEITEQGLTNVTNYANALVAVPDESKIASNLTAVIVTPSTSSQTIEPDDPYDGFAIVEVNAVTEATQATPSISVNSSTGLITASAEQSAGLVAAGTKTATSQLSTQAAAEITPTTSQQTAVAAGKYTLGNVVVKPIPSEYIVPSGSLSITENDTYDVTDKASVVVAVEQTEDIAAIAEVTQGGQVITNSSISFTVLGQPKKWAMVCCRTSQTQITSNGSAVNGVFYDGTNISGAQDSSGYTSQGSFSQSYDSSTNTLTISASGSGRFYPAPYKLLYTYDA